MTTLARPPARRLRMALRMLASATTLFAITCVGAQASATPNPGGGSGVNATVAIAPQIKSVTVAVSGGGTSLTYSNCSKGNSTSSALGFPNGLCITGQYVVTNTGNTPEQIDLQGSPAVPISNSTSFWNLCGAPGPSCTGAASNVPGTDEFLESTHPTAGASSTQSTTVTTAAGCDIAFELPCQPGSTAASGQAVTEYLQILGPQSTTDQSSSFSMTVIWTAI